jgi:UDP-N-acetyl-D-glucosamine dehydrogenase
LPTVAEGANYDVAVVGAGYVGLPLAATFAEAGCRVLLVDVLDDVVAALSRGESHIDDVPSDRLAPLVENGLVHATTSYQELGEADAILIALPTPLSRQREPDLSIVEGATRSIAEVLHEGQLVVLESTTWPGTTREVLQPILEEASGLRAGEGFFLAMSPERVDPGREDWTTKTTPKVLGGITPECTRRAADLYRRAVDTVHELTSPEAAELTKLLENIFRSVNIALVNELAILCDRMGIDIWEVVDAAATKPFGYMRFSPGPGLGGHCIPIDPFYLSWKARQSGFEARFIELAGQVNASMPHHVARRVNEALNLRRKSVRGAKVLVLGIAYKADIDDVRESPSLDIIETLSNDGAKVEYSDPFCPSLEHNGRRFTSRPLTPATLKAADCVVIATAHKMVDYGLVARHARAVVDCRNVLKGRRTRGVFRI